MTNDFLWILRKMAALLSNDMPNGSGWVRMLAVSCHMQLDFGPVTNRNAKEVLYH